ncbi:MAG: flippase-like domain-containing protein [Candidatus Nanopelagicales bacterium]
MTDVGARPGDTPAEAAPTTPSAPSPDEETPRQTVAIPRPTNSAGPQSTVVIEDGVIPRRLRRPLDLARFLVALAATAATVLVAYFATGTTEGIEEDISGGAALLPSIVILAINIIGGIGLIGLPIAAAINLVIRRRVRQLFDALVGLLLTVTLLTLASYLVETFGSVRLVTALAGSVGGDTSVTAPIIGGLTAFVTVARLMSRRPWDVLSVLVVGSLATVALLSGTATVAGLLISFFAGWGLGLLTRYTLGTPTTRPLGSQVAETMARGGYPLTVLRASRQTAIGRRYVATTRSGESLEVVVLDRDLEGAGLASAAWKALRLRDETGRGAFNMRRELDHAALMAYAAQAAHAPVPRLLLTSEVGADSALLAYDYTVGTRFCDLDADQITDDDLEQAWRAMRTLHESEIAHRSLTADNILRDREGKVWLVGEASGTVAASDVAQRIDVAELLCTLALIVGADRAIRTGRRVLGVPGLARALPVLQPVALAPTTRRAMRKNRDLMVHLRDALVEIRPDGEVEQINVERIKPRTLIMIVVGTIAAYVLLSQLAQVDLGELLTSASLEWLAVAVVAALVTYVGAAWSLSGFVPERIPLHRTMLAQVAGDFATLVSPPTLGSVAINMRFLTKAGLHPALAGASVGVSQVAAFAVHLLLLLGFGIAAGTQADFTFDPPPWAVIAVIAVVTLFFAAFAVPPLRRYVFGRVRPLLREVIPRLVTVAQRPTKLVEGVGGIVLLNLAYIVVLVACVRAFDGDLNIAAIAVVYLAGATIGQAAPTPGGLGAVEAALAAGLTAAGLPGGIAVSAVLLFRLITFWIPTIPGYAAFNWLTKKGYL